MEDYKRTFAFGKNASLQKESGKNDVPEVHEILALVGTNNFLYL
jgi:hypothetical protein